MYSAPESIETRRSWPLRLLLAAHWLAVALPWLFLAALTAWAGRAAQSIGHWPVPLLDDPKFIAVGDRIYDWLGELANTLLILAFVSPFILPVLAALTWRNYRPEVRYGLVALYSLGMLLILIDPFGLLTWMFD